MPLATIPLVGSPLKRGLDVINYLTKDRTYSGVLIDVIPDSITKSLTVYLQKRPGFKTGSTISSGQGGSAICDIYGFINDVWTGPCTAFFSGTPTTTVKFFIGTTQIGTESTTLRSSVHITKAIVNAEETFLLTLNSAGESGWFIGTTGMTGGLTFTANTNTSVTLSNVSSFTGLVIGQKLTGTDIPSTARIQSMDTAAATVTMTSAATGTTAGITVTREQISRIISSNFPSIATGPMQEMDGFVFAADGANKRIYQSALNDISTWSASNYLTVDTRGDFLGISKYKNYIVSHCSDGFNFYKNVGNRSGSVLSMDSTLSKKIGSLVRSGGVGSLAGIRSVPFSIVDDNLVIGYSGLFLINDTGTKKISDGVVDRLLTNQSISTLIINAFSMLGKYYVLVTNTLATFSFIYDMQNNIWTQSGFSVCPFISKHLGETIYFNSASLHYLPWSGAAQTPAFQDDGVNFTVTVQTENLYLNDGDGFTLNNIDLIADNQTSGTVTLEISRDDYATWTTYGTYDLTLTKKRITSSILCDTLVAFRMTYADNTDFRAQALKVKYTRANV